MQVFIVQLSAILVVPRVLYLLKAGRYLILTDPSVAISLTENNYNPDLLVLGTIYMGDPVPQTWPSSCFCGCLPMCPV